MNIIYTYGKDVTSEVSRKKITDFIRNLNGGELESSITRLGDYAISIGKKLSDVDQDEFDGMREFYGINKSKIQDVNHWNKLVYKGEQIDDMINSVIDGKNPKKVLSELSTQDVVDDPHYKQNMDLFNEMLRHMFPNSSIKYKGTLKYTVSLSKDTSTDDLNLMKDELSKTMKKLTKGKYDTVSFYVDNGNEITAELS